MIEIAPSILSADLTRLGDQVAAAFEWGARRIHVDVMDGHFVPNLSLGSNVVHALRPLADRYQAKLEVHLMVEAPERHLADFAQAGADLIMVHDEATPDLFRAVQAIRRLGVEAGVALNPATTLGVLDEILPEIAQVLVMTVSPGFGGQELIPWTLEKVARLRTLLDAGGCKSVAIEVDGGIHEGTIAAAQKAGATLAVAGSAVFNLQGKVAENLQKLQAAARRS